MKRIWLGLAFSMLAGSVLGGAAAAGESPDAKMVTEKPAPASGWYYSADGAWRNVKLPTYATGFRRVANPVFTDGGAFQTFNDHIDGYMFRGAAGYFLPSGMSNTLLGASTRVEIGGLYTHASGQGGGTVSFTDGGAITQTMDGAGANTGYVCSPGQTCRTESTLTTKYSNWQAHGKIAGDYSVREIPGLGDMVLTPSLAVFGGRMKANQRLDQTLHIGAHPETPTYNALSTLRASEFGARAGLDMKIDVTPEVTLGLGGSAGIARRHTTFDGNDVIADPLLGLLAGAGAASGSANATPFLANAEASVTYKCRPDLTLRGFAGADYDTRVAGVASSSYGGVFGGVTSRTPAHVTFHPEASLYAGGGVTWTF